MIITFQSSNKGWMISIPQGRKKLQAEYECAISKLLDGQIAQWHRHTESYIFYHTDTRRYKITRMYRRWETTNTRCQRSARTWIKTRICMQLRYLEMKITERAREGLIKWIDYMLPMLRKPEFTREECGWAKCCLFDDGRDKEQGMFRKINAEK